jgi:glycosyltransferase involved in cell wall biosynthesis
MSGGASEPPLPHVATVPLVSVVTAARDAEATVARALESLLAQTFRDWEAIVVDDGSSDGTAAVASEFLERDSRIRVLRRRPAGVSDARNAGVEAAKGRWLLFLDADDWLLPEALQRLTEVAAADPAAGVVHGGWVRFNNDGDVVDASAAARSPLRDPRVPRRARPRRCGRRLRPGGIAGRGLGSLAEGRADGSALRRRRRGGCGISRSTRVGVRSCAQDA